MKKDVKLNCVERIQDKNNGWKIIIDDGYCAFSMWMPYSKNGSNFSISSLANMIRDNYTGSIGDKFTNPELLERK